MQRFEWVELWVVAGAVYLPVAFGTRLRKGVISVLLISAVLSQAIVEGFRWQLIPLHVVAVVMAITDFGWQGRKVQGWPRIRRALLGAVGLGLVAVLPLALPVPELPRPSGPFAVGTRTFVFSDPSRAEIYGRDPTSEEEPAPEVPRRIMAQVWYPAQVDSDSPAAVWNPDWDVVGPALSDRLGFPNFFLSHVGSLPGHAVEGAPPMSGSFPVIIYSHGWTGFRTIALDQIEALASEGYMVIAPDHTYGSVATRFTDTGEVVLWDPAALPEPDAVTEEEYDEASEVLVETYADDLTLLLDRLGAGAFSELSAHTDLTRIGFFGHSTGGGAAVSICLQDSRCKAVVGLDAWVEPVPDRLLAETLAVPSMFMRSRDWQDDRNDARLRGLVERSSSTVYWFGIDTADHNDFVMTPLFSPVADRLGLKGPIDSDVIVPFLHEHLDSFFDLALMDGGGALFLRRPPADITLEVLG